MYLRRIKEYLRFLKSLFKTNVRLLWGMWKLTSVPHPSITIFGGARITNDSLHARMATQLAKMLASNGFSILTGGGPGIMEAANLGAIEYLHEYKLQNTVEVKKIVSAGIGVVRLNIGSNNPYVQKYIEMQNFFSRKWLLVRYSIGFVIFPGGFGTLDELFEVVTLVQTNKMAKFPIILIDKSYWQPLVEWIEKRALAYQLIEEEDRKLIQIVDTPEEAFDIIFKQCKGCEHTIVS